MNGWKQVQVTGEGERARPVVRDAEAPAPVEAGDRRRPRRSPADRQPARPVPGAGQALPKPDLHRCGECGGTGRVTRTHGAGWLTTTTTTIATNGPIAGDRGATGWHTTTCADCGGLGWVADGHLVRRGPRDWFPHQPWQPHWQPPGPMWWMPAPGPQIIC